MKAPRRLILVRLALSTVLALSFAVSVQSQTWVCPDDMPHEKSSGLYSFKFNSWKVKGQQYNGEHSICHCLKNLSSKSTFVDWEGTAIRGIAGSGRDIYSLESFDSEKFKTVKRIIWFGASPDKVDDVDTLVHDPTIVADSPPTTQYRSKASIGAIVNHLSSVENEESLIRAAENADLVDTVAMTFEAKLKPDGGGVEYSCVYSIRSNSRAPWNSRYQIGFKDTELNELMLGTEKPLSFSSDGLENYFESDNRKLSVKKDNDGGVTIEIYAFRPTSGANTSLSSSAFQITSESGLVAASMPVAFWSELK